MPNRIKIRKRRLRLLPNTKIWSETSNFATLVTKIRFKSLWKRILLSQGFCVKVKHSYFSIHYRQFCQIDRRRRGNFFSRHCPEQHPEQDGRDRWCKGGGEVHLGRADVAQDRPRVSRHFSRHFYPLHDWLLGGLLRWRRVHKRLTGDTRTRQSGHHDNAQRVNSLTL